MKLTNDTALRLSFNEMLLDVFWILIKQVFQRIFNAAVITLLQFSTMYLCEQSSFYLLLFINNRTS